MKSAGFYRAALAFWSFVAGLAVMFTALWMLDMAPGDIMASPFGGVESKQPMWHEYAPPAVAEMQPVGGQVLQDRQSAIVTAVEHASPAVVSIGIVVEQRYLRRGYSDYLDYFYNRGSRTGTVRQKYPKVGTGFLINSDGVIVTNHHVIENGDDIVVTLQDGREFDGKILGVDKALDIAVLKVDGENLPYVALGNSDNLHIGEWAIAIGNPFGSLLEDTQPTVTVGVISAVNRLFVGEAEEGRYYQNMIQTDAAINPGNSGGPLLNARGEVVGINTFIFTQSGGSIGLGFARPINVVKRLVDELLTYGRIRKVDIGIAGQPLSRRDVAMLNLPAGVSSGFYIAYIDPNGPAAGANLQRGDIVYELDGIPIKSSNDANAKFSTLKVGDVIELSVYRDGNKFKVKLQARERQQ